MLLLLPDGVARHRARGVQEARGGREREGHNFQIYVQMFRAGCAPVSPPGEDAYRKVLRRIEKCSRGFRARAMMEHGANQLRWESRRPFTSVKRRPGWVWGGGGEDRGHRSLCLFLDERLKSDKTFSPPCALNNTGRLMNETSIQSVSK